MGGPGCMGSIRPQSSHNHCKARWHGAHSKKMWWRVSKGLRGTAVQPGLLQRAAARAGPPGGKNTTVVPPQGRAACSKRQANTLVERGSRLCEALRQALHQAGAPSSSSLRGAPTGSPVSSMSGKRIAACAACWSSRCWVTVPTRVSTLWRTCWRGGDGSNQEA
jgi:hypothetical protein